MRQRMGQVVGQNQEAFHDRSDQHHNHRKRDVCDQLTKPTANRDQSKKRRDGRNCRRKHRQNHPPCRVFCCCDGVLSQPPGTEIRVFTNHDGVIHHDAQCDDQSKERDHVDRDPKGIHQRDPGQHRHRNARRDPQRNARVQEQEQQQNNQAQTHESVLLENVQTSRDRFGPRADQINRRALGQGGLHLRRHLFDAALDADGVARRRSVHTDCDRRIRAYEIGARAVDAFDSYVSHIADGQRRSILIGFQHDCSDLVCAPFFDPSPNPRVRRIHVARRVCADLCCDGRGDFGHAKVMGNQLIRRHLDQGLRGSDATDRCASDT